MIAPINYDLNIIEYLVTQHETLNLIQVKEKVKNFFENSIKKILLSNKLLSSNTLKINLKITKIKIK